MVIPSRIRITRSDKISIRRQSNILLSKRRSRVPYQNRIIRSQWYSKVSLVLTGYVVTCNHLLNNKGGVSREFDALHRRYNVNDIENLGRITVYSIPGI